jgi:hypothetical protein
MFSSINHLAFFKSKFYIAHKNGLDCLNEICEKPATFKICKEEVISFEFLVGENLIALMQKGI